MIHLQYNYINPKTLTVAGNRTVSFTSHQEFIRNYELSKLDDYCIVKVMFCDLSLKTINDLKLNSIKEINV